MKTKVLILGATGAIALHVIHILQENDGMELTLFARHPGRIVGLRKPHTHLVMGDVLNTEDLDRAIQGKDVVYANLAGAVDDMATEIVRSMEKHRVKRLVFVASLGIYDEVPGTFGVWNGRMIAEPLAAYKRAAETIEASNLDYTIIRPAWLTDNDEIDYETTQKGEDFKGTEVSRKSVGDFIARIIQDPHSEHRTSVGINKPGTDGDKPSFY